MIREEREKNKDSKSSEVQKIQKQYEELIEKLKTEIKEKDKEIQHHKNLLEESKQSSQREVKLISSALYEMGLELQRLKAPKPNLSTNSSNPLNSSFNDTHGSTHSQSAQTSQPKSLLGQLRK